MNGIHCTQQKCEGVKTATKLQIHWSNSPFENNVSIFDTALGKRCHLNKKLKNCNHNPNFWHNLNKSFERSAISQKGLRRLAEWLSCWEMQHLHQNSSQRDREGRRERNCFVQSILFLQKIPLLYWSGADGFLGGNIGIGRTNFFSWSDRRTRPFAWFLTSTTAVGELNTS